MNEFKIRLIDEQVQLEEKLIKLNLFISSEKINTIDPIQKDLLIIQANAMQTYNECLKARISKL